MKAWMRVFLLITYSGLLTAPLALGQQTNASKPEGIEKQDQALLIEMARSALAGVAAGQLAARKASSEAVRLFGQRMAEIHGRVLDEGSKLSRSKGIEPPSAPSEKHQAALEKLQSLNGLEFDRAYIGQMISGHREALKSLKQASTKAVDSELRALANQATLNAQEFLEKALEQERAIKASGSVPNAVKLTSPR